MVSVLSQRGFVRGLLLIALCIPHRLCRELYRKNTGIERILEEISMLKNISENNNLKLIKFIGFGPLELQRHHKIETNMSFCNMYSITLLTQ